MKARLFCRTGRFKGLEFEIRDEATIGSAPDNSIVLEDNRISARHARIRYDEKLRRPMVEDLGSLNGTRLDGVRLTGPEPLPGLHVVTFADRHDFVFQASAGGELPEVEVPPVGREIVLGSAGDLGATSGIEPRPAAAPPPTAPETAPPAVPPAPARRPVLEVLEAGSDPRRIELSDGRWDVGRGAAVEVRLEADSVSRRHARFTVRAGRVLLRDLGSHNHTYVDDRRIDDEVEVRPGARIRFAQTEARLLDDEDDERR